MFEYEKEDIKSVILWQYETATRYKNIIKIIEDSYNILQADFWEKWYRDVFNIDTANDFGLYIWSLILKTPVQFDFQSDSKTAFGFREHRKNFSSPTNFGNKNGGFVNFTTEQKRLIIKCRYFQISHKPTMDNINAFLKENFWKDDNRVYVLDNFDMQWITYSFFYRPDAFLDFLLNEANILPRPAGVGVKILIFSKTAFGFGENRKNFAPPSNFGLIE
ncbi:hypothetical protein CRU92_10940 [Arcobacter sp. FW59]|nr:hypothetical protein CRU92_10940 [Arcobacter sp. FW59]